MEAEVAVDKLQISIRDTYAGKPLDIIHKLDAYKDLMNVDPRFKVGDCKSNTTLLYKSRVLMGNDQDCEGFYSKLLRIIDTYKTEKKGTYFSIEVNPFNAELLSSRKELPRLPTSNMKIFAYDSGRVAWKYFGPDMLNNPKLLLSFYIWTDPGPSSIDTVNGVYYPPFVGNVSTFVISGDVFNTMMGVKRQINIDGNLTATLFNDDRSKCIIEFSTKYNESMIKVKVAFSDRKTYIVSFNDVPQADMNFFDGNNTKNTFFNEKKVSADPLDAYKGFLFLFCKEYLGDVIIALTAKHYMLYNPGNICAIFTCDAVLAFLSLVLNVPVILQGRGDGIAKAEYILPTTLNEADIRKQQLKEAKEIFLKSIITHNDDILMITLLVKEGSITDIGSIENIGDTIKGFFTEFNTYIYQILSYLNERKGSISADIDNADVSLEAFKLKYSPFKVKPVFKGISGRRGDTLNISNIIKDPLSDIPPMDGIPQFDLMKGDKGLFSNYLIKLKFSEKTFKKQRVGGAIIQPRGIPNINTSRANLSKAEEVYSKSTQGVPALKAGQKKSWLHRYIDIKAYDKKYAERRLEAVQKIDEHIEKEGLDEYLKMPDSYYNEFYNDYVKNIIRSIIPDIPKVQKLLYTDEGKETIEEYVLYDEKEIFDMYYILCDVYGVVIEDPDILKTIILSIILSDKPLGVMMKEYKILIDTLQIKNKNITHKEKAHEEKAHEEKAHEEKAHEEKAHEEKAHKEKAHEEWEEMVNTSSEAPSNMALKTPVPKAYFPGNNLVQPQTTPLTTIIKGKAPTSGNRGLAPAMVIEGGRKKTIRRKKPHTKKRTHHSSKTKRKEKAKRRTHKK
jgi:hypothetical protein